MDNNILIWSVIGNVLLAGAAGYFIYRNYKQHIRSKIQLALKRKIISRKKEEIVQ